MVISPCKKICALDKKTNRCIGCDRSIEEIEDWYKMDNEQKILIMRRLRKKKINKQL